MEHLSLEIFDLSGTGSKHAMLPIDASITITETSDLFASGNIWSFDFKLNVRSNAHIFGSSFVLHGSRLHELINNRKARLWVEGLPLYLGYLHLDNEAEIDSEGNISIAFESGQKTFDNMIDGAKAREVSVGDVVIGVALNRKRVVRVTSPTGHTHLDGLEAYSVKDPRLSKVTEYTYMFNGPVIPGVEILTPYAQRWPKLVKSHGRVFNRDFHAVDIDYTNVQTPYDASHPYCNVNLCYQLKANKEGEEVLGRGYTMRLAHGSATTDGGDNETRYNNAPNFYLLYFIDRLFKDLGISIQENQAYDVEDLRRVFMLNFGCHYEEVENTDYDSLLHTTPSGKISRYDQYYLPIVDDGSDKFLLADWEKASLQIQEDESIVGKILLRDVEVHDVETDETLLSVGSIEGNVTAISSTPFILKPKEPLILSLDLASGEKSHNSYSAYLAYATGDNYPDVEIRDIIDAMKSMFGVRFIFNNDYSTLRIILLRNVFRNTTIQNIVCDIADEDVKVENGVRGFRMTYGKGTEDTNFYYKGFNDMFPRVATTWKDTTDKHDYSQWVLNADYNNIKQHVSAMNKTCYVTPVNGNAYAVKIDEEEDVLFPSLFEVGSFLDAEDGDCTGKAETIETVQIGATPVVMNEIGDAYAILFTGDLKAPTPEDNFEYAQKIATFARVSTTSFDVNLFNAVFGVKGKADLYISEGFQIRLEDNYGISNSGTPFDNVDLGLCFGIMRGSGSNAHVAYHEDLTEDEDPVNDYWEVIPGDGAIDHPDTCDNSGNLWDYNGDLPGEGSLSGRVSLKLRAEKPNPLYVPSQAVPSHIVTTRIEAANAMKSIFTTTNVNLVNRKRVSGDVMRAAGWTAFTGDYATLYSIPRGIEVKEGIIVEILFTPIRPDGSVLTPEEFETYLSKLGGPYVTADIVRYADAAWEKLILDMNTTQARAELLHQLQAIYYATEGETVSPVYIDSSITAYAVGRYLEITNKSLRRRGLCDQFYKEYSYWVRNARIVRRTVKMELSQLLSIDKTVRVKVGDVTGFIKKMQYTISNKTGLGMVSLEIMYI